MSRVAAIVLAAGRSSRMEGGNKLLATLDGTPLIARTLDAVLASRARPVIVVLGHRAADLRRALGERAATVVDNPEYASGLASSLRRGIAALPAEIEGALFCLGDMPRLTAAHIDRLIDAFAARPDTICLPVHDGKRGNPVLWPRRMFGELAGLSGDVGGRGLLDRHPELLRRIDMPDDAVLIDVDTPDALAAVGGVPEARP